MRDRVGKVVRLAAIASLLVTGCAASGTEPSPPPAVSSLLDVASYCQARAKAECNALVVSKCGATDATACETARTTVCKKGVPQGTVYVAAHASKCIDLVTSVYADAVITLDENTALARDCGTSLFSGPGAARSPCNGPYDCSSRDELTCIFALGATTGKCLTPTPVAAAASCADESNQCPDAFFCDGPSKTCQRTAIDGESCSPTAKPCGPGLTCPGSFFTSCRPKQPKGHACLGDDVCADGICDKAASATEGNCTDRITLSTLDAACASFH